MEPRTPRVVELFAGAGGAALGLARAGWRHLACVERDPAATATLRAAGLPGIEADVRDVDWSPWAGQVDLMWASPPCQPGSVAGKRRGAFDDRDGWPWTFAAVDAVRPIWFLAENVLGWTRHEEGCRRKGARPSCVGCYWLHGVVPEVRARFPFAGWWTLDAADYGTPQRRRRIILWAGPLPLDDAPPPPTHADPADADAMARGLLPWRTIADAIGDTLHRGTCDRRACYPCDGTHGRACTEPWRIDRPSPTLTTTEEKGTRAHASGYSFNGGPDRASDAAFLVAGIRRIGWDEGLALQGFPDDWPLQGTVHDRYLQVGNAVPPQLAAAVGRAVMVAHRVLLGLRASGLDVEAVADAARRNAVAIPTTRAA
ncbi:DNA cytosine methyltransferase [Myxococcota bacterium]|nr:DNA cytosine methyltransferase [Myxococcota bacterium]